MALLPRLKGILNKAVRNTYRNIGKATGLISRKTYDVVTSAGLVRKPFEDMLKSILPVDRRIGEIAIPTYIRPFSAQLRFDPRIRSFRDASTGRTVSETRKNQLLSSHRRNVLMLTIKRRNSHLSERDVIKKTLEVEDKLKRIQDLRKIDELDPKVKDRIDELQELKEELGLFTP